MLKGVSQFTWEGEPLNPLSWEGNCASCGKALVNGAEILLGKFAAILGNSIHNESPGVEVVITLTIWTSL